MEGETWRDITDKTVEKVFFSEIVRGMGIALSQIFREPATINYPFEKGPLSPRFRGEHALRRYYYNKYNWNSIDLHETDPCLHVDSFV